MRAYELHASAKQIQRSKGRSSVAASAYRAASRLYDERTGLTHDFTKKSGVELSRLYTPENAPDWAKTREEFWNAVEAKENRSNSMTAREWVIGFPAEFNAMQRRESGDAICHHIMQRFNTVVDISYHKPDREGDARNFHAHILYATRGFDQNTQDGWDTNKYRHFSKDKIEHGGEKITSAEYEVRYMRDFIASEMNRIAERDGLEVKTEHLSFELRGIDQEPSQHLGHVASDMERKNKRSERGDVNRQIETSNDNRISLKNQQKIIDFEYEKQRRALGRQPEPQQKVPENEVKSKERITPEQKDYSSHQRDVAMAQDAFLAAKNRLETMSLFDRLMGRKTAYQKDVEAKEMAFQSAQSRLKDLMEQESKLRQDMALRAMDQEKQNQPDRTDQNPAENRAGGILTQEFTRSQEQDKDKEALRSVWEKTVQDHKPMSQYENIEDMMQQAKEGAGENERGRQPEPREPDRDQDHGLER